jgi:hypothetical protein
MKTCSIFNGFLVHNTGTASIVCGYIFEALGKGAFEPTGRVQVIEGDKTREATSEEIQTHNNLLARAELDAMEKHGKGVLYLSQDANGAYSVASWSGLGKTFASVRKSWHNMAGRDGRRDVYFVMGGKRWHGVNIGDNQICRCHVLKKQR